MSNETVQESKLVVKTLFVPILFNPGGPSRPLGERETKQLADDVLDIAMQGEIKALGEKALNIEGRVIEIKRIVKE